MKEVIIMQCHVCKKTHVDHIFYINLADTIYQMPICEDCLQKRWQAAVSSGQAESFKQRIGWYPGQPKTRQMGDQPFPELAVEGLRTRRKLQALNTQLDKAEKLEHYEEAAKLRDDIAVIRERGDGHGHQA